MEIPFRLLRKKSEIMLMSRGLVASRILCKQDDIILRHVSVKMSNRKHENKVQPLLDFFGKKLWTEVESESTK